MNTRLLLADDDVELLDIARILFRQTDQGLELLVARSVKEALEVLDREEVDVVIADYLMPDATGLDLLEAVRCTSNTIGFIIWTAHSREDVAIKALNLGADFYLLKGTDIKEQLVSMCGIVRKVIDSKHKTSSARPAKEIPTEIASEFIHGLSHDVTGVLHNIMGYATLLEDDCDKTYIQGITRLVAKLAERIKQAVSDVDSGILIRK